jgi:hypothetical protein
MATTNNFVKSSFAISMSEAATTICPVEETGKNSVNPSINARIIA